MSSIMEFEACVLGQIVDRREFCGSHESGFLWWDELPNRQLLG